MHRHARTALWAKSLHASPEALSYSTMRPKLSLTIPTNNRPIPTLIVPSHDLTSPIDSTDYEDDTYSVYSFSTDTIHCEYCLEQGIDHSPHGCYRTGPRQSIATISDHRWCYTRLVGAAMLILLILAIDAYMISAMINNERVMQLRTTPAFPFP